MSIMCVVGARPQFIKAAPVLAALRDLGVPTVLVHTGQHYDVEMSAVFFEQLGLPEPDLNLGVGSGTHAGQTAGMLVGVADAIADRRPGVVVVFGDTNTTLAGALAAAKLNVPVAHVEAGLRSFDRTMPEEVNRVVADHLSTVLFAPTATATANLAREGITHGVYEVGDVMTDVLLATTSDPHGTPVPGGVPEGEYVVATIHRAATTDDPARLAAAVDVLGGLGRPVVFPVHPRTRGALEASGLWDALSASEVVVLLPPLGYRQMTALVAGACGVVTDSGGLQKEAYVLGVPVVTLREETEWPETVAAGWNHLVGLDAAAARAALGAPVPSAHPELFGDGRAAPRMAAVLAELVDAPSR